MSITAQSEEITTSQSEKSKSGPKWKPAEVDLLICGYRCFRPRFDKKNETEKKILLRGNLIVLFMAVFLLIYNDFPINSGSRVHEK